MTLRGSLPLVLFATVVPAAVAFQSYYHRATFRSTHLYGLPETNDIVNEKDENDLSNVSRRSLIKNPVLLSLAAQILASPIAANAGIDVSGLKVEGSTGSSTIANQLKAYDGSGSAIVREIKSQASSSQQTTTNTINNISSPSTSNDISGTAATYALRASLLNPKVSTLKFGTISRREDQLIAPKESQSKALYASFEFPSDWLQLDKMSGGIQYVDQRNGDKLYILRAKLPPGKTLETVSKDFFGDVVFDSAGSIIRSGTNVDEYRVSKSVFNPNDDCPSGSSACAPHRRLTVKYYTVTGNGLRVERRGLIDAYEIDGDVYMLMTSSNAVKFEAKGKERETVESIVKSFRLERL